MFALVFNIKIFLKYEDFDYFELRIILFLFKSMFTLVFNIEIFLSLFKNMFTLVLNI